MSEHNGNGAKIQDKSPLIPQSLPSEIKVPVKLKSPRNTQQFTPSAVLRQSPFLSRAILWGIMGLTSSVVLWASFAKIEEAIPTQGKLEPQGTVKEVQVPVGGLIKTVHVKDGGVVKKGDLILKFDSTAAKAELESLNKIRNKLLQENQFYRYQLTSREIAISSGAKGINKNLLPMSPQMLDLTKSRTAIISENRLYRLQLANTSQNINLSPEEQARLQFSQEELKARISAEQLETQQIAKKVSESQATLSSAVDIKQVNQTILNNLEPLVREGAIGRLQYLKQQQDVRTQRAEIERLQQEQARLKYAITQSQEKVKNTIATAKKEILTKIADNEKQIAQIDSELNKAILENEKKVSEIDNKISQTKLTLQYQELRAPSDGIIFDLKARSPGFVASPSQTILKIVPKDALMAKVYITNKDIGFVQEGMKVDVRIDSFPFSEFGDIKGELVEIASDALPPEQTRPYYSFPAKIRLKGQSLSVNNRKLSLQSGMSISANIKLRERTVMSIFTDLFTQQIDNLKTVR
ncbi:MAG: HlyD family type I secretion periplasmic adaptor subunit [Scytonematopsis contorta HA4267-MV1]|jgi:HlyD family type I secretion membrane fusion protein|nr:HlyD family type I secretion periplasmic adaptor subunit [Scytonematopsis contorta HA4267-MV1]